MTPMTLSEMLITRKGLNNLINFCLGSIKRLNTFGIKSSLLDDLKDSLSNAESALKKIDEEIIKEI